MVFLRLWFLVVVYVKIARRKKQLNRKWLIYLLFPFINNRTCWRHQFVITMIWRGQKWFSWCADPWREQERAFSIRSGRPGRSSYQKNITRVSEGYLEVNSFWSRGRRSSINLTLPPRFLSTYCQCSPPGHQSRRIKIEHDTYKRNVPNDVQKSFFNCVSPFCPAGQLGPAVPQPSLSGPGFL